MRYLANEINQKKSVKLLNFAQTQLRYIGFIKNAGTVGEGIELEFTVFMYETTKESKKEWLVLAGRIGHLEEGACHQVCNLSLIPRIHMLGEN